MYKILVLIVVEKIYEMQHLEGSGTPFLYIGRKVLKDLLQLGSHPVAVVRYTYTHKQYRERHKTNNT